MCFHGSLLITSLGYPIAACMAYYVNRYIIIVTLTIIVTLLSDETHNGCMQLVMLTVVSCMT